MSETRSTFSKPLTRWLIAGAAVLTIGIGVGIAEWGPRYGGPGGWRSHGPESMMRQQARICERDPLRYEGVARAFLRADLDLKAEQNAEMEKLAAILVPALKDLRDEVCNNFAGKAGTAPERLERLAIILRKAADAAEKTVQPAKSFYATLDDRQKARVDELAERRRMRGHHGGHHGGGFGGPGMGGSGMGGSGMGSSGEGPRWR
ncbi:MAG: Spy/CpxP family protein refolding chaperone [Methylobacterium sp.]|nr:Spy/CpxP family protein refolding chaperone [Methylobacterium sp.]